MEAMYPDIRGGVLNDGGKKCGPGQEHFLDSAVVQETWPTVHGLEQTKLNLHTEKKPLDVSFNTTRIDGMVHRLPVIVPEDH